MRSRNGFEKYIRIRLTIMFFSVVMLLVLSGSYAMAEGSKELNNENGNAYRAFAEWDNGSKNAGVERTTLLKVILKKGERVCLGSSVYNATDTVNNRSDNDILIRCQTNGQEYYFDVKQTGEGYIQTRAMELAGPNYDGTVTDGYEPLYFEAPYTGIYEVEFHALANTVKKTSDNGVYNPDASRLNTAWNRQGASVAAWDVTVLNYKGEPVKGRVFTNYIALNTGTDAVGMYSNLHILTTEGYQYNLQTNGIGPYGFILYANNVGMINGPTGLSLYKNAKLKQVGSDYVPEGGVIVPTPDWVNKIGVLTHRIFFNDPDDEIAKIASDFPITPREMSKITKFEFIGNIDGTAEKTTEVAAGGTFNTTFTERCTYDIMIDSDDNGKFEEDKDVVLSAAAAAGSNSILWDGKDNNGNALPAGDYNVRIRVHGGEFHFPMIDAERCPDGLKINLINAPQWLKDQGYDTTTVYYDSRDYITYNGTDIKLTGTGKPDPLEAVKGISSKAGAFKFGSASGTGTEQYGNDNVMDVWSYITDNRAGMGRVEYLNMTIKKRGTGKQHGAIMGTVYFDSNKNKVKESSEKTMEKVEMILCKKNGSGEAEVSRAATNGRGQFVFNDVPYSEAGEQYVVKPNLRVEDVTHTQTTTDTPITLSSATGYVDNIGLYTEHDVKVEMTMATDPPGKTEIESGADAIIVNVTATNTKAYPANNTKVKMPIANVNGEPTAEGAYQGTYGNGLWNIGKIPAGETVKLKLKMYPITLENTAETVEFKATASCDDDNDSTNNIATVSFKINPSKDFSVVYDGNNGSGAMTPQNGRTDDVNGGKITLSQNQFIRPGYKFLGWTTDKDVPVVKYEDEAEYIGTGGGKVLRLYALWEKLSGAPAGGGGASGGSSSDDGVAQDESESPEFGILCRWDSTFPEGLEAPIDISKYKSEDEAIAALNKIYSSGMKIEGKKDGKDGIWTFNGWKIQKVGENNVMQVVGSWSFEEKALQESQGNVISRKDNNSAATGDESRLAEAIALMIMSLVTAGILFRRREE